MSDLEQAARLALDALEHHTEQTRPIQRTKEAIAALRAALEQAAPVDKWLTDDLPQVDKEQAEPVQAWIQPDHLAKARVAPFLCRVEPTQRRPDFIALYTAPPAAKQAEPVVERMMVRCPRCWEPVFAPKAQEQAEPVAMSASLMTKEAAFINGKLYHIDPRQAQWSEDRIRAVQAEPAVVISPPAELKYMISPERMCWDDAVEWAASLGMRLATVEEMQNMSLPPDYCWSGTEYSQSYAWYFSTYFGYQNYCVKSTALFAVAVAHKQAIEGDNGQSMTQADGNASY
jgi:hypothetical protein